MYPSPGNDILLALRGRALWLHAQRRGDRGKWQRGASISLRTGIPNCSSGIGIEVFASLLLHISVAFNWLSR